MKSFSKYRVVKSLGSSKDPPQVEYLWRNAHYLVPGLIGQASLNFLIEEDEMVRDILQNTDLGVCVTGPERILGKIFTRIGFNEINDELFRHLVITRLVYSRVILRPLITLQSIMRLTILSIPNLWH